MQCRSMTVVPLHPAVVYRAPSGRLCRLVGPFNPDRPFSVLQYALRNGSFSTANNELLVDGFRLSQANYRLLTVT